EKTQSHENAQKTRRIPTCPLHALLGVVGVDAEERCARLSAAMIRYPPARQAPSCEYPGSRCGLWIRCRCCSDRSNFGEPLDCVLVVPADGGFPCGPRLRGDIVRLVV